MDLFTFFTREFRSLLITQKWLFNIQYPRYHADWRKHATFHRIMSDIDDFMCEDEEDYGLVSLVVY